MTFAGSGEGHLATLDPAINMPQTSAFDGRR